MTVMLRTQGGIFEREEAKYPWVAACDERWCYFTVSAKSEGQGNEALEKHKCPYGGNERSYFTTIVEPGSNMHESLWAMLDSATDGLMYAKTLDSGEAASADWEKKSLELKGRASGLASAIMLFAGPYFEDIKDVSRWALERYKMRIGERDWEPTVGCEGYDPMRGEPSPRWATKVAELRRHATPEDKLPKFGSPRRAEPKAVPRSRKPEKELTDAEKTGIKNALAMGLLDDKTIADMFGASISQIVLLKA